jgi:DNA-binding GntR family transcriptional regulator
MKTTTDFSKPVDRLSLGDAVYDRLSKAILAGQFACGHQFNEVELANLLAVSRTPVREALRRLANDGLVTITRSRHPTVVQPTCADVIEAFQVRRFLEAGAASLAAERMDAAQLNELRDRAAEAKPGQRPDWCEAERRFDAVLHQTIALAAGNARLRQEIERYLNLFRLLRHRAASNPDRLAAGHREHLAILEALEARDPPAAALAMTNHIDRALQAMLVYLP